MDKRKMGSRLSDRAVLLLWFVAGGMVLAAPISPAADDIRGILGRFEEGDPGWKARMESMVRIARLGPEALPVLLERLRTGAPPVREFSAQVLAGLADPRSRTALVAALDDPSPQVRVYAVRGVSALDGDPPTAALLHGVLERDSSWAVRHSAAWALERDGPGGESVASALGGYDLEDMDTAKLDGAAPDFALVDIHGRTHRLGDYRGRSSVLLKFYQEPL